MTAGPSPQPTRREVGEAARRSPGLDLVEFSELVRLVYAGAIDPSAWRTFLRLIAERLQGNAAVLILRVPRLGEIPMNITHGAIPDREALYFKHFMAVDPFVQLPEGRAVTMHDFVDADELERSEYFQKWLVPMDMVYAIGVDMRDSARYHVRLRICRPRKAGNFSAKDCAFVEMFVPHLKTAIHLFSELDVVRTGRNIYAEAMDQLTLATIVLDENGRVLHANRLAESILAQRDGITRANDMLQLSNREDAKRFRELHARAVDAQRTSRSGLVEVMRIRRPSGQPDIGVVVRPASSSVDGHDERLTASVAVFLSAETEDSPERAPPSEVIQKLFGLTPKEASLALRLAGGDSLQQAARTLGISTNTARAHLRSIFAKTGVDRQAKLVRVLLKSVAMLGQ
jgi:DNA-binding CsgD family transcriptional regulator/PAS domain-containing protein